DTRSSSRPGTVAGNPSRPSIAVAVPVVERGPATVRSTSHGRGIEVAPVVGMLPPVAVRGAEVEQYAMLASARERLPAEGAGGRRYRGQVSPVARRPDVLIAELRDVLTGPLAEIAQRFSTWVDDLAPHSAMVIFTRECTGWLRKVACDPSIVDRVTIAELDRVRNELAAGEIRRDGFRFAGRDRE